MTGRSLGWAALVAAVAAITVLVPPLVAPKNQARSGTASASPPSVSTPSTGGTSGPSPSSPNLTSSPSLMPSPILTSAMPPAVSASATATRPPFTPIRLLAADPGNVRSGARVIECASCQGGSRVGYIGGPNTLIMLVRGVRTGGRRTLTVTYETEARRTLKIAVNQDPVRVVKLAGAKDLMIPAVTRLSISLPAGTSSIKFYNDEGSAPDVNGIVIS